MALRGSALNQDKCVLFEDFLNDSADTIAAPWATTIVGAGPPVADFVDDQANGEFRLLHESTSEAQNAALHLGDDVYINPTKGPVFECRLKIDHSAATTTFTADQRLVFGLCNARNATLDSNTRHAWFRVEGANNNVLCEGDDGTTDTDDLDTGFDYSDSTYHVYVIDMSDTSAVRFMVDGVPSTGGPVDVSAMAATDLLQPFFEIQRDAGTEVDAVFIDYVRVEWDRA